MSDRSSRPPRQTALGTAVLVVVLALGVTAAFRPGSGLSQSVSPRGSATYVFDTNGKRLGKVTNDGEVRDAHGGYTAISWLWLYQRHQIVYFYAPELLAPDAYGYARVLPGQFWYVEAFFQKKPYVRTIGTVRRRTSRTWDAYSGLGAHAHRIGSATGPHPAIGAVARLLAFSSEPGREPSGLRRPVTE
jgi:hypothetical protein